MSGPLLFDRVRESSTTTGTGSFTTSGTAATGGYRRFQDVLSTNDTCYYVIQNPSLGEWEVGLGTFTSPTTLARTTVLSSSNSGSLTNFSAGTKDVWIDWPAAKMPTNVLTGYLQGFPISWGSSTTVVVGYPNANAPGSLARDSADAVFMPLAGGTTYTISTGTLGAILGQDRFQGQVGTVSITNGSTTITGTSTAFKTLFGTRTLTGTSAVAAGTAMVGTGTKYLTEVAVNDLVGNSAGGWARVTAIADNTHLTLSQTMTLSSTCTLIEQPTFEAQNDTYTGAHQVDKVTDDTHLVLTAAVVCTGTIGGNNYWVGRLIAPGAAPASGGFFGYVYLVQGTTGLSSIISTQRTTPYSTAFGGSPAITGYSTNYRRIGSVALDYLGNIIPFTMVRKGTCAEYEFIWDFNATTPSPVILNAGAATNWVGLTLANLMCPPTATQLYLMLQANNSFITVAPRGFTGPTFSNTVFTGSATPKVTGFCWIGCDGSQAIQYQGINISGVAVYANVAGYLEEL